jgi:HEAT repeat protein
METVTERVVKLQRGLFSKMGPLLESALRDRSPKVRGTAIDVIIKNQMKEALPLIEPMLFDRSATVRMTAAEAIGALSSARRKPQVGLRSLLKDPSPLVRIQSLESLAELGDRSSLPLIAALLADDDPLVRAYAARSIADLKGSSYVRAIRSALDSESNDQASEGMVESLFFLGNTAALNELLELLSSEDYRVRCAVANSLEDASLNAAERQMVVASLSTAYKKSIGVADRSTIERVLSHLKSEEMLPDKQPAGSP